MEDIRYLKVKDNTNLFRDSQTNSIVNTNMNDYKNYITRKNLKDEENQKIHHIEEDLANLRSDISEIKNLLRKLSNESR